jgi:predicted porin
MKKSLVALAALAATSAFAQSSVQIDGLLDAGYQSIDYKGNKANGINGNGSSTSQINFRGVSDLGGGLKADFRVETDWNTVSNKGNTGSASSPVTVGEETVAAASSFGNGEVRVGLAGGFGRVDLGAVNYNTLSTFLGGQPFGTAIGSGFRTMVINDTQATSQVRAENALKYTTPTMSGFNATLYKSNKQTKAVDTTASATAKAVKSTSFSTSLGGYDQVGTQEIGLNYANGPIAASYSSLKQDSVDVGSGTTANTVNTLGGSYTMGAAKFFLLNQTNKTTTGTVATNNKAMTLSAMYTMGNVDLMVQSGSNKNEITAKKSKLTGIGANYNLSKTAFIYLRNEKIDDAGGTMNAAVTPSTIKGSTNDFSRTGLGLVVKF